MSLQWGLLLAALLLCGCDRGVPTDAAPPRTAPMAMAFLSEDALLRHVRGLAEVIGERNTSRPDALAQAAELVDAAFRTAGYDAERQVYTVDGVECVNLAVTVEGTTRADEIVVVGAHYDSAPGTPGADDNATGTAVLLELARAFRGSPQARTLVFVAFVNEEPPHFRGPDMGSIRWADAAVEGLADGQSIVAMISLESIGYFDDAPGSQQYPPLLSALYPDTGDFLAVVGDLDSRALVAEVAGLLEAHGTLGVETISAPSAIPGIDWSDHASFWPHGIPAVMVTDTATYRNPHYHEPTDTVDTLDGARLAAAAEALQGVVEGLASPAP